MFHFKHTLALLTCALAAGAVNAATVQIKFDDYIFNGSGPDDVRITFPANSSYSGPTSLDVAAGRFQGTAKVWEGVAPSIFFDGVNNVFMYCYDVYQHINHGWSVDYEIDLNAATSQTLDFIGSVNSVLNSSRGTTDSYAWLRNVTAAQGAAIQLGIWESLYETGDTWALDTGSFTATGLGDDTANWWTQFNNARANSVAIDGKYVMVLKSSTKQDMIAGDPPSNDVPEPGSLALIGLALAGLAATRRKSSP